MYLIILGFMLLCSSSKGLRLATSYDGCSKSQMQCAVANETVESLDLEITPAKGGQHHLLKIAVDNLAQPVRRLVVQICHPHNIHFIPFERDDSLNSVITTCFFKNDLAIIDNYDGFREAYLHVAIPSPDPEHISISYSRFDMKRDHEHHTASMEKQIKELSGWNEPIQEVRRKKRGAPSVSTSNSPSASFVGRDFFFGIPLTSSGQSPVFDVTIGTPFSQADYVIESNEGMITSGMTNSSTPAVFRLNSTLQVTQSGLVDRMNGIRVRATSQNSIYVLVTMKYNDFGFFVQIIGYSSYLIHPNSAFPIGRDYVYYAISAEKTPEITNRNSNILLIGNHDQTTVSITPTQIVSLPIDAQSDSTLVNVTANTTHNVTLNRFQTLLFSSILDLTGTKVVSNKPLTVITGHQCAQIPSTTGFCEPIYIHALPTFQWGREFLLAPFGGRTMANQYYKLVTSVDSTTIAYSCGNESSVSLQSSIAGSGLALTFFPDSYCYLNATNPIFLVQMAPGSEEDGIGDPALTIIAPTTKYVSSASFVNLPSDFLNSFITVTVPAEHFSTSQIQFDGNPLNCIWHNIHNTLSEVVGHGCIYGVTAGTHVVSHSGEAGVLSVLAYGWSNQPFLGYAYLTNFNLGANDDEITAASTTTQTESAPTTTTKMNQCPSCSTSTAMNQCPSCSTSTAQATVITAIITALLATVIFLLVQIAICKCHPKFAPGKAESAPLAGGKEQEQAVYEQVDGSKGGVFMSDSTYVEIEAVGGGRNTMELKNNEAYGTVRQSN